VVQFREILAVTTIRTKDDYVAKSIEAIEQRTPSDIQNETGFDFRKAAPLRSYVEGLSIVVAVSDQQNEAEVKKQARESLFFLAGVETFTASKASGALSITSTQAITIPAGEPVYSTEFGTRVGEVIIEVVFASAETLDVDMISDEAGADVVFVQNDLFILADNQSGGNLTIINNGADEESDYDRSKRIRSALLAKTSGTVQALTDAANNTVLIDGGSGNIIESVISVFMSFPWKVLDPNTIDPTRLGEIVMSIQSSLGVPSQDMLDAIELNLVGTDELDPQGRQGAGQNVLLLPVETEDVAFSVPYKKVVGGDHSQVTLDIQGQITTFVDSLVQGQDLVPTNWQAAISGDNKPDDVDYYDEGNLTPSTVLPIDTDKIWNITAIVVTEI
jgi:hypothetical protein